MKNVYYLLVIFFLTLSCQTTFTKTEKEIPFDWKNVNLYFLLIDRFNNGDTSNDINFNRTKKAATLRGFEGGDLKGIIKKINEGYFTDLGINAIWMTPVVEQIHGATDEGTGLTYGYHGYWAKDWTTIDPNYGTKEDLHELVKVAHENGIRILLDAVINHTGPVTEKDPVWPENWVRTSPKCEYNNYNSTVDCTLVENLPDIRTDSNENVELPLHLVDKWKQEGRYDQEIKELDDFFARTNYPRTPRYYIIKWLTDYIIEFGIDGYRADTVKHTEDFVWSEFKTECDYAFQKFKENNPEKVLDDNDFYLVGEVYNYGISSGKYFNYGDKVVDFYDDKFTSQINFEFKWNAAQMSLENIHMKYDSILHNQLEQFSVLNYLSSHDDGNPFDTLREKTKQAANILLLSPGGSQMYYGDETARILKIDGAIGDANLRSFMNWNDIEINELTKETLIHYQKLGKFKKFHPAIGAGKHHKISNAPYTFARTYTRGNYTDLVVIMLDGPLGKKEIDVSGYFKNNQKIIDAYSGITSIVTDGKVVLESDYTIVLLESR